MGNLNRRIASLERQVIASEARRDAAKPKGQDCAHKAAQLATARALSRLKSRFEEDFR